MTKKELTGIQSDQYEIEERSVFHVDNAQRYQDLYLPLTNGTATRDSIMNSITPNGHGDSKLGQNAFLMEPVTQDSLYHSMSGRNFWCCVDGYEPWSVYGLSYEQMAAANRAEYRNKNKLDACKEKSTLTVGRLWQKLERKNKHMGIEAQTLTFCPAGTDRVEISKITIRNTGVEAKLCTFTAAIPLYGRSADNIRDHRHVTSLLNRVEIETDGVTLKPVMSFNEKGHYVNEMSYSVLGRDDMGNAPEGFYPTIKEFIGKGGTLYGPKALKEENRDKQKSSVELDGEEALGGLRFKQCVIQPGESREFVVLMSYDHEGMQYLDLNQVQLAFDALEPYWKSMSPFATKTANQKFDVWMDWVGIQPCLRRIFGCSFLPHHDYGRGGRGWRDLWQDCLALLLTDSESIRDQLMNHYAGVRLDGSNATIIGNHPGEFIADRNSIVRVWMDHGYWPFLTTKLYLNQTGDYDFLFEQAAYFYDGLTARATRRIPEKKQESGRLVFSRKIYGEKELVQPEKYKGTILEHILIQNITQFFDVGVHNHMRLRGADWNDAYDCAQTYGESVAFTAAYSGNFIDISGVLEKLYKDGHESITLAAPLVVLLNKIKAVYASNEVMTVKEKHYALDAYYLASEHPFSTEEFDTAACGKLLMLMGQEMKTNIRVNELLRSEDGLMWFNGYYDDAKKQLENAEQKKMLLTSQVFTIMSGTATDEQIADICKSVDALLYEEKMGGYRLNTDFGGLRMDMGRAFSFAYGNKENGAVFSHMAVMYGYALYERGFVKEGYKVIKSLFNQCMDFEHSEILPGIPEYFNQHGKGLYHYLTGAASWLLLTVMTQSFGLSGVEGDLNIHPKLLLEQFDQRNEAAIQMSFAKRTFKVTFHNENEKEYGDYEIDAVFLDGKKMMTKGLILREHILQLSEDRIHELWVELI